ncbi:MAG: universal stress protein, partial [Armatimonadetes bacterium]|nr:universal stress protein [Armatimonadota bacterium]
LGFSAMLAGLAAGFAVVNRDRRDVRAFRAINDFEPPIYGIFFALAGVQLHLRELVEAGAVGLAFVLARAVGKLGGAWLGARFTRLPAKVGQRLGLGLLSQAGLAIGLAYLVQQDRALAPIQSVLINIVVASVVINELLGPPLERWILVSVGEAGPPSEAVAPVPVRHARLASIEVVPWTWPKLTPPRSPTGSVVFGVRHPQTVRGLARIAILLANYYQARPIAVRVITEQSPDDFWAGSLDEQTRALFAAARAEGDAMGYRVDSTVEFSSDPALGLVNVATAEQAQAVVLGHPLEATLQQFSRVVDQVGAEALCPVVVAKFQGPLHTERILVPITSVENLKPVLPVIASLAAIEHHEITVLHLLAHDASVVEERDAIEEMQESLASVGAQAAVNYQTVRAEARVLAVSEAAHGYDILVMALETPRGLRRIFFGSMAEDVAMRCTKPILMVRAGIEDTDAPA